jgi:hypothetical protein
MMPTEEPKPAQDPCVCDPVENVYCLEHAPARTAPVSTEVPGTLVNHAPNCDCTDSRENFECDSCRLRFGPCMGNGDDFPESCDRCANLKVAEAQLQAFRHDGAQWQACPRCSEARTKFIVWLRDLVGVREDATTEEFKAAVLASLGRS